MKLEMKMEMKLEICDISSSSSDVSNDSQNSEFLSPTLVSLDGLHSGVPTRTTPTLTPTTLRNIEQTFIELQCEPQDHVGRAGFIPPPVAASLPQSGTCAAGPFNTMSMNSAVGPYTNWNNDNNSTASDLSYLDISRNIDYDSRNVDVESRNSSSMSSWQSPPPPDVTTVTTNLPNTQSTRRNMGGRRPKNPPNISPEEEDRRSVRRERNKMAAARCRKRRMDHTNELVEETEALERKKQTLQGEIQQLQQDRDELQFILEAHRACCRLQATSGLGSRPSSPPDIKPLTTLLAASEAPHVKTEPIDGPPSPKRILLSSTNPMITTTTVCPITLPLTRTNTTTANNQKPNRPSFLNVPLTLNPAQQHNLKNTIVTEIAGIPITTPSTGIPFNFDSLMDGGTGLTPVSNCAVQQRNQPIMDFNLNTPSLETPTQNKLVIL